MDASFCMFTFSEVPPGNADPAQRPHQPVTAGFLRCHLKVGTLEKSMSSEYCADSNTAVPHIRFCSEESTLWCLQYRQYKYK